VRPPLDPRMLTVTDAVAKTNLVHIVPLTTIDQRFTRIQIGLTEKKLNGENRKNNTK